jgi:hypothetical protein
MLKYAQIDKSKADSKPDQEYEESIPRYESAHEQGRKASTTTRALAPIKTVSHRFCRLRLPDLWLSKWPRNGLRHFALPFAVAVNRFLIPL